MRDLLLCGCACLLLVVSPAIAAEPYEAEGFEGQPVLVTTQTADGGVISYPSAGAPQIVAVVLTIQPGGRSDLHHHPVPAFVYVLEGEFELRQGNVAWTIKAGEALVEPIESKLQAFNPGSVPTKVLVVHVGSTEVEPIIRDQ
jgi:quercetin dioxygenase-like cupin family protein